MGWREALDDVVLRANPMGSTVSADAERIAREERGAGSWAGAKLTHSARSQAKA